MIRLLLFFSLLGTCLCQVPCNPEGTWASWTEWTTCPENTSVLMNFKTRIRQCEPVPLGCDQSDQYSCPGTYSEVAYCTQPTTIATTDSTTVLTTTELQSTTQQTTLASTTARESTTMQVSTTIRDSTAIAKSSTAEIISSTAGASSTAIESSTGAATTEASTVGSTTVADSTAGSSTVQSTQLSTTESITSEAATTMEATTVRETTISDSSEEETTEEPKMTCDKCPELNIFLFDDDPYEDGASVLNRFTSGGCKYVQFFCRPFKAGDNRTVRTIYDGDGTMLNRPLNANFECKNKKWKEMKSKEEVESLSCVYDLPPTTTTKTTTPRTTTTTTTRKPTTTTRDERCFNCSYLVASPPNQEEGSTYLDHQLEKCLSVHVFCRPIMNNQEVDLLFNEKSIGLRGKSINRTFECTQEMKWIDKETKAIVNSVSCAMIAKSPPKPGITTTTVASTETTEQTAGSTEGSDGTTDMSSTAESSTTYEGSTTIQRSTIEASTGGSTAFSTTEMTPSTSVKITGSTTTTPGKNPPVVEPCNRCYDIVPKPLHQAGQYNGMLVLDNFIAENNCRKIEIDCRPGLANQNATLLYNGDKIIATGVGSHHLSLQCQTDGTWKYQGTALTTISCMIQEKSNPSSPTVPTPMPTEPPIATTPLPGTDPCSVCSRMRVDSVDSTEFIDGSTTLDNGNVGSCHLVQLKCQGVLPSDKMVLMMRGTEIATGTGMATINLTCSDMSMWTTNTGIVVPHVMCGIRQEITTSKTTTIVYTITTVTTPEVIASKCNACDNLQAIQVPSLGANEQNGMLIIEHSYEGNNCRVAVVRCRGDSTDNMTILFNGVTPTPAAPFQISSSLTCSSDAKWMRLGETITSVACKATKLPSGTARTATTTTGVPVTTTTAVGTLPCSNCNRQFVTSVSQANYKTGFLVMDKYADANGCLGVYMSCSSPTTGSDVAFVNPAGDQLACEPNQVNMTMTCNEKGQWVTQTSKIVDTVSCGVVIGTTTKQDTVTVAQPNACTGSTWAEWREWSDCTKPCGSCGTHQRFRACNKASPECLCPGTAYEKVPCNLDVCVYPERTCCEGFNPQSSEGKFQCLANNTVTNRMRL